MLTKVRVALAILRFYILYLQGLEGCIMSCIYLSISLLSSLGCFETNVVVDYT